MMLIAALFLAAGLVEQDYSQPDFTHAEGTPWCFELEITGDPVDCALALATDTIVMLDYTIDAVEDEWGNTLARLDMAHHGFDGRLIQTFSEVVDRTYALPEVADINNDGSEEILIPTYTGNVNTVWQVYQSVEGQFVHAGEVSGLGLEYDAEIGQPVISARGSASTWYRSVWFLGPDGLALVYELETDLGFETCTIVEGSAMAESAVSAAEIIADCEAGMDGGAQ